MLFSKLYGEYLDIELGTADRDQLFTTARRRDAINRAQAEFASKTECFRKSTSVTLADGTREYDLEAVIAADDFVAIAKDGVEYVYTDADGNVTYRSGDDFPRIDLKVLNREQVGWRGAPDSTLPASYYVREDTGKVFLGLSEAPDIGASCTATLTIPYLAIPPDLSNDSDEPFSAAAGVDQRRSLRPWHQGLVHYAAALLEPLRKNYTGEQRQRQLFASYVADYLQRQRKVGGNRIVMARDYRAEASSRGVLSGAQRDWRVWP